MKFVCEKEHGALYVTAKNSKGQNRAIIAIDADTGVVGDISPCADNVTIRELYRLMSKANNFYNDEKIKKSV